jgi:hypothetical protein
VKRPAPLERDIQQSICEYLTARRHFFWRNNTGAAKLEGGRFIRFGTPGSPDLIVVHVGRPYFLEVKRPGTYQSPDQKTFQAAAEKAGALYAVVRSIDDVTALGL